jgi:serine protease
MRWAVVSLWVLIVAAAAIPLLPAWRETPATLNANAAATLNSSELIVDLRDDATPQDVAELSAKIGVTLRPNSIMARNNNLYRANVRGKNMNALLQTLQSDARVEAAEPEAFYRLPEPVKRGFFSQIQPQARPLPGGWKPNDPRYNEQWNFHMIGAEQAWTRAQGQGVVVAVIDTGIAVANTENGKQCRDFAKTSWTKGYNFIDDNEETYDDLAHGTHVGGTIAESTDNGEGVAGLAFKSTLMPLKVFGANGYCTSTDIADAIRYAVDHGANVINMSLGGPYPSQVMYSAVRYARRHNVLVVCSAGNGFGGPVGYPAAYWGSMAVSAVGPNGKIATYSSYGPQVAIAAPGGDMMVEDGAGVLQNTILPEEQGGKGDDYYEFQGTSMASPHVAAVAALVMSQGIADAARVRDILKRSADPQISTVRFGSGILSADGATAMAAKILRNQTLHKILIGALALLVFLAIRDTEKRRLGIALAFAAGAVWPSFGAHFLGVDNPTNLASFSALIPFLLFWELEEGYGNRLVCGFAFGVATGFAFALTLDGISPLTTSTFGSALLPWTIINGLSAVLIGVLAAKRAKA